MATNKTKAVAAKKVVTKKTTKKNTPRAKIDRQMDALRNAPAG
jgi:hypothetical protein